MKGSVEEAGSAARAKSGAGLAVDLMPSIKIQSIEAPPIPGFWHTNPSI
jgi:hypothetical protein